MSCFSILRRIGILPKVTRADFDDAGTENIERSAVAHKRAVERSTSATLRLVATSERLRQSISRAGSASYHAVEQRLIHR